MLPHESKTSKIDMCMRTREYYSDINKDKPGSFAGAWMHLKTVMLCE